MENPRIEKTTVIIVVDIYTRQILGFSTTHTGANQKLHCENEILSEESTDRSLPGARPTLVVDMDQTTLDIHLSAT